MAKKNKEMKDPDGPRGPSFISESPTSASSPLQRSRADVIFFSLLLWGCAGAAVWLFLHPAAWQGRNLAHRLHAETVIMERERALNQRLQRWREGLESDTSMIEREARRLGYGRLGEKAYSISSRELLTAQTSLAAPAEENRFPWPSALEKSLLPAIALLITGILAVLFFTNLKIEEPPPPAGHRSGVNGGGK